MERGAFLIFRAKIYRNEGLKTFFSHPDYTVGTGISPVQRINDPVADYTAGGELRPAPKN